tara:strand:- start:4636 stop:5091 length:456 start_codon:yes stop_codon:yes gene_type:complete
MKYLFALTVVFISFGSIAQTDDVVSQPVRRCEVMPAFGECVDANASDAYQCSSVAIVQYLDSKLKYPTSALELNITGSVYIVFVVELDGTVSQAQVLRSFNVDLEGSDEAIADLEAEAVRAISDLPAFRPGTENGEAVRVEMVVPVKFILD